MRCLFRKLSHRGQNLQLVPAYRSRQFPPNPSFYETRATSHERLIISPKSKTVNLKIFVNLCLNFCLFTFYFLCVLGVLGGQIVRWSSVLNLGFWSFEFVPDFGFYAIRHTHDVIRIICASFKIVDVQKCAFLTNFGSKIARFCKFLTSFCSFLPCPF